MVTLSQGTQWNGTPGRPNHPPLLRSALLRQANQIPSRRSRWSISSSPFSRWDYLLRFKTSRVDVYCGSGLSAIRLRDADAGCPRCQATWDPKKNVPAGGCSPWCPQRGDVQQTPNPALHMTFNTLRQIWGGAILIHLFLCSILLSDILTVDIKQLLHSKNSERFLLSAQNAISPDKKIIPYVTTQFSFLNRPVLRLRRWLMLGLSRSVIGETMQQKRCGSWHVTPDTQTYLCHTALLILLALSARRQSAQLCHSQLIPCLE